MSPLDNYQWPWVCQWLSVCQVLLRDGSREHFTSSNPSRQRGGSEPWMSTAKTRERLTVETSITLRRTPSLLFITAIYKIHLVVHFDGLRRKQINFRESVPPGTIYEQKRETIWDPLSLSSTMSLWDTSFAPTHVPQVRGFRLFVSFGRRGVDRPYLIPILLLTIVPIFPVTPSTGKS